ncbi:hypothetical protein KA078_00405 [Candidatus Woesebacteria bacterium]|nr:hypothetical protein [Candidatus Woesebacteria bacterium]
MDAETIQLLKFISYLLSWTALILAVVIAAMKNPGLCILMALLAVVQGGISYAVGYEFISGLYLGSSFFWIAVAHNHYKHPK